MFTTNEYYTGTLQLSQVEPDNPDGQLFGNVNALEQARAKYEREALITCLGFTLYDLFNQQFDIVDGVHTLKDDAADKWNDLLNGTTYTQAGVTVEWRGLIFEDDLSDGTYKQSLLAYYVYAKYIEEDSARHEGVGFAYHEIKNAQRLNYSAQYAEKYNKFVAMAQGPTGVTRQVSLYEFITDMNSLDQETYPDHSPTVLEFKNRFGI